MLPKVRTALSQFIKPISSSAQQQTVVGKHPKEEKKGFQKFTPPSHEQPTLKVVQNTDQNGPIATIKTDSAQKFSVASSFLQLLTTLQKKHHLLKYWRGIQTYFAISKSSKKSYKLRKGAIIDHRIE